MRRARRREIGNPGRRIGNPYEWYHSGIMPDMGMTLRTSEKQTEALRRQALAEGRSMQAVALTAIDEYIERRAHQTEVNAVLDKVIERERGVLRRLADT